MPIDESMVGRSYPAPEPYQVGREKIREFADAIGDDNPAYRGDDAIAPPTFAFMLGSRALASLLGDAELGLRLEPGNLVLELRPPGVDKGTALRELVASTGARAVLYAGDDLGDLAAYDAVAELRSSGMAGLLVAARSSGVGALADRADIVVEDPAGVVTVLTALADAISARLPR